MNPEKLPQNQNNEYDLSDLLPAEREMEDVNFDQLDDKVTAAENHHKNEVERQERHAKLETARQQLSEASMTGAGPAELLNNAKSLTVSIPTKNKYGIVAMADKPKAKAAEESTASEEGESTEPAIPPATTEEKQSWLRHPVQRFRQEADKVIPTDEALDSKQEAAEKAAAEAAEHDKNLIDADAEPTRFTPSQKLTRAEKAERKANTKAAMADQKEREAAARKEGKSAADAIRSISEVEVPTVVKVEAKEPEEAEEPVTAKAPAAKKSATKPAVKVVAVKTSPAPVTSPSAIPTAIATGRTPSLAPMTLAESEAAEDALEEAMREGNARALAEDIYGYDPDLSTAVPSQPNAPEATTAVVPMSPDEARAEADARMGQPGRSAGQPQSPQTQAYLASAGPVQMGVPVAESHAPEATKVPEAVVGSGPNGEVTLADLADLDSLLPGGGSENASLTVESKEGDTEKTQPLEVVGADDGSALGALENALRRGSETAESEEGESAEQAGRVRRMRRAVGAVATRFMDSRLMTGRWRDASAEARQARQDEENITRRERRQIQLNRDASRADTGIIQAEADPGNPDNPDGDDENTTAVLPVIPGELNPDDSNGTGESDPERRRRSPSRRTRRLAGLALAGSLLAGGAVASAEIAPDSHAPRTSTSAEAHGHNQTADKAQEKQGNKGADTSDTDNGGKTGSSSNETETPSEHSTAPEAKTEQHAHETLRFSADGKNVTATLKSGGTIFEAGTDAGLSAAEVMNAVNEAHISDDEARGMQVDQQLDFHKNDNGEWTVKIDR